MLRAMSFNHIQKISRTWIERKYNTLVNVSANTQPGGAFPRVKRDDTERPLQWKTWVNSTEVQK
jgi:hypothetical protein